VSLSIGLSCGFADLLSDMAAIYRIVMPRESGASSNRKNPL
jgi:hypothetical protein